MHQDLAFIPHTKVINALQQTISLNYIDRVVYY